MSLPTRQIGGHKAALNNPNVPEETKEHSRQMIDELEQQPETQAARERSQEGKEENRVIGGYKATLKNPNVGEEAKQHAKEFLEERDAL